MKTQGEAGFTLIEMLVVVVVLSILLTMIVPRFTQARNTAHNAAAEAYAHNVAKWLASAEAGDQTNRRGSLGGSCLSQKLQAEGAPANFPGSVSSCIISFQSNFCTVTVTAITGKGGLSNNGIFDATY